MHAPAHPVLCAEPWPVLAYGENNCGTSSGTSRQCMQGMLQIVRGERALLLKSISESRSHGVTMQSMQRPHLAWCTGGWENSNCDGRSSVRLRSSCRLETEPLQGGRRAAVGRELTQAGNAQQPTRAAPPGDQCRVLGRHVTTLAWSLLFL